MAKKKIVKAKFGKIIKSLVGNRKSATRLDEAGKPVRMAKSKTGGANKLQGSTLDKKIQRSPAAEKVRKVEGKAATDLLQPARGSLGKTVDEADVGVPSHKVAAKKAGDFDKALSKKETQLKTYQDKRDSLTGVNKIEFIAKNQTRIKLLKASIKDMKSRGGPGGITAIKYKKSGGVVKKAGGGMTRQGLYPAEMARAGTMSQAKRKRYMKKGGKITYRMTGGQVVDHGYD